MKINIRIYSNILGYSKSFFRFTLFIVYCSTETKWIIHNSI